MGIVSTNYHTAIATGAAANASVFNAPLGTLDTAITANTTSIAGLTTTVQTVLNSVILGGAAVTLTNGAASAAQKVVTVDSSAQFVAGCYVEYTRVGGVVERNVVDTVDSSTQITLITNIGTGGIADNSPVSVIPLGFYNSQAGVFNILNYGASPSASAATNTAAIQAAINALDIEDAGATGDYAGTLLIPPGVFEIDDTLTFASLRGFKLTGTGHASRLVWTPTEPTKNMIEMSDCRDSRISDLQISTSGTCNAAIKMTGTAGDGVPTHNLFENVMMDIGGAQYGFQIGGASPATDANNDFMEFHNCEVYNYLDSGVVFVTNSQAYNYLFLNCAFLGDGTNSKYAIDCGSGGSVGGFSVIGGATFGHTVASFRLANTGSQPVLIQGHNEEGNNRFVVASSLSQVEIKQCRLSASGVNADKILILAGGLASSLIIDNCVIGDGVSGGTTALMVARVNYGSAANGQVQGRFIFTNNLVYSTLNGTTWDDWPIDNANGILPTEAWGNLIITDIGTLVPVPLDFSRKAPTGAFLESGTSFIEKCGGARVVRTSNAAYNFTTFVHVPPYHIFTVICDHTNTFVDKSTAVTGDNLWLAGHVDWTATVGSSITFYHDYDNDRFIELSRSQY